MKLGEALSERARLQRKIGELRTRIVANASVQEDTEVAENPVALIDEALVTHDDLSRLIKHINLTNAHTKVGSESLTAMLAERDYMAGVVATLKAAADAAQNGPEQMRYMRSELKMTRQLDVKGLRSQIDTWSSDLRELDTRIQEANWNVDLRQDTVNL